MKLMVTRYEGFTSWLTSTRYQVAVVYKGAGNTTYFYGRTNTTYFYGRTMDQAIKKFYAWLGEYVGAKYFQEAYQKETLVVNVTIPDLAELEL